MLPRSILWPALLAASSVLVGGCRLTGPGTSATMHGRPAAGSASQEDLVEAHAHYSAGVIHDLNDEPELALKEYCEAALKDPTNETLVLEVTRRCLEANQLEQAEQLLVRATRHGNASGALYARLGFVYSRLGKTDPAIKAERVAIQKQPRSLTGYQNLFVIYLQDNRPKEALAILDKAAAVPDTDAAFLIGLAETYANFGLRVPAQRSTAFARALAALDRAEQMEITDPQLELRLADGFDILGKDDRAARIYAELLRQVPVLPFVRNDIRAKLADIYLRDRNNKLAAEQLEAIVRDNPTDAQANYLLGSLAYDQKDYAKAEDCLTRTLLLKPDFQPAYYDLAGVQISEDKSSAALETLEKARQRFQQNFVLEYLSGMACSRLKDFTNAVRHFTAAEIVAHAGETNRLTVPFYFQFGAACERCGDYEQAEKNFEECLRLEPDYAEALNYLGFMWADRGEKLDRARELIAKALHVEPKNAAYLDSMGWVLFRLHQPHEALDYILQAIQCSESPDATIYDHLGDIYAALGQANKAREAWRKSLSLEPSDPVRRKLESKPAGR